VLISEEDWTQHLTDKSTEGTTSLKLVWLNSIRFKLLSS